MGPLLLVQGLDGGHLNEAGEPPSPQVVMPVGVGHLPQLQMAELEGQHELQVALGRRLGALPRGREGQ